MKADGVMSALGFANRPGTRQGNRATDVTGRCSETMQTVSQMDRHCHACSNNSQDTWWTFAGSGRATTLWRSSTRFEGRRVEGVVVTGLQPTVGTVGIGMREGRRATRGDTWGCLEATESRKRGMVINAEEDDDDDEERDRSDENDEKL